MTFNCEVELNFLITTIEFVKNLCQKKKKRNGEGISHFKARTNE